MNKMDFFNEDMKFEIDLVDSNLYKLGMSLKKLIRFYYENIVIINKYNQRKSTNLPKIVEDLFYKHAIVIKEITEKIKNESTEEIFEYQMSKMYEQYFSQNTGLLRESELSSMFSNYSYRSKKDNNFINSLTFVFFNVLVPSNWAELTEESEKQKQNLLYSSPLKREEEFVAHGYDIPYNATNKHLLFLEKMADIENVSLEKIFNYYFEKMDVKNKESLVKNIYFSDFYIKIINKKENEDLRYFTELMLVDKRLLRDGMDSVVYEKINQVISKQIKKYPSNMMNERFYLQKRSNVGIDNLIESDGSTIKVEERNPELVAYYREGQLLKNLEATLDESELEKNNKPVRKNNKI